MLAGVKVIPFKSKNQAVNTIISEQGDVLEGVAVAVNPEKVIKALEDQPTMRIINSSTIQYADGIGVVKALERKTSQKLARVAGCELWLDVLNRSIQFNLPVVLIGAQQHVVEACANILKEQGVNIVAFQNGFFEGVEDVLPLIEKVQPKIVIVAQGSPRQEKLIDKIRDSYSSAFFMGVGGSFDVLAGEVPRAPKSWQKLNLEWLYRLAKEPKRIFRQKGLVKFVWLAVRGKL
ncbi:WecB/TagA/CpsF family glycosyltransferase [Pseudoalteromonas pernae]|uniref:WecB/TagA/CpsF family glycosyltransferase n=1 Tax=Pseudoalteromonas pernae TaxID=3118054 RepID=UPI003241FF11